MDRSLPSCVSDPLLLLIIIIFCFLHVRLYFRTRLLQFVDGNGLLSCESVSYCWRCATDRTNLWKVRGWDVVDFGSFLSLYLGEPGVG